MAAKTEVYQKIIQPKSSNEGSYLPKEPEKPRSAFTHTARVSHIPFQAGYQYNMEGALSGVGGQAKGHK